MTDTIDPVQRAINSHSYEMMNRQRKRYNRAKRFIDNIPKPFTARRIVDGKEQLLHPTKGWKFV